MDLNIERIEVLLLIAAIVAIVARRARLPYTVGLVITGAILAVAPQVPKIELTKEMIFTAFLPPLIFEAAIQIPWTELRRDLAVILLLATLGVLLSTGITAMGIRYLVGWDWMTAILVGVILAATDPVSVIATFKEARVEGRLRLLVEAESLFNDGTVAVLFGVALTAAGGGSVSGLGVASSFLITFVGGIASGLLVGGVILLLAGRTEDHLIEITFTTVAAYGSFLVAEHFHLSGVLATLSCGLLIGNWGSLGAISDKGREAVLIFWEYIAFVANSLIFLLIGLQLAQQDFPDVWFSSLMIILLITLGRALAVYICSAFFARSSLRVKGSYQHILFWGGLRGALALALVLGLPAETPHRHNISTIAFAVVAFSVIVQGLTFTPLLRKLGELGTSDASSAHQSHEAGTNATE